jgi:hypothetical protein
VIVTRQPRRAHLPIVGGLQGAAVSQPPTNRQSKRALGKAPLLLAGPPITRQIGRQANPNLGVPFYFASCASHRASRMKCTFAFANCGSVQEVANKATRSSASATGPAKIAVSITVSELRYVYRNWGKLSGQVILYVNLLPVASAHPDSPTCVACSSLTLSGRFAVAAAGVMRLARHGRRAAAPTRKSRRHSEMLVSG